jgi:hypothetical protein
VKRLLQRKTLLSFALALLIGSTYFFISLTIESGRPVAPLDDAYITLQYARQIARGHPYQYNDGDPPTTGMTSPLFGFLTAGFHLLGFTGERLVGLAVGLGFIWLGLIGWLTYRSATRLIDEHASRWWPLAAAVLVILTGSVQWACFNGMETGLFTVLALAALDAFLAERAGFCALWLGLAGLIRPEGLLLAALLLGTKIVGCVAAHSVMKNSRKAAKNAKILLCALASWREALFSKQTLFLLLAVLAGCAPLFVNWLLSGTTASTGLQAKSWWLNVPCYPEEIARSILHAYDRIILGQFLGFHADGRWFVPPGLLFFSAIGWIVLAVRRRWALLALTALWFFGGTLSTATLITATWHEGRYQVPFVPLTILLAIYGLAFLQQRAGRRWQNALLVIAALFLTISSLYSTLRFRDSYRRAVSTVARQQLVVADWMHENLPADARVGVHDTGSLRYVGERETYDLIGLTTAGATIPWRHGAGSVFELMEHSPMRPDYFAIYPDVFSIPYLAETDLFAEELFRVEVPDYAIASASAVQGVWRADWHLADSGAQFYQPDILERTTGLRLVDTLDVADLDDEAAHNVEWWQDARRTGFPTEVQQLTYRALPEREVLDGGRLLTGGMALDVTTDPQEPLWIVARLHAREGGTIRVEVDGHHAGQWNYPPVPGEWLETLFRVPAEIVTDNQTRVTLSVDTESPDFSHYAPYYFWFLQGAPPVIAVEIEQKMNATFGKELALLGFDLPQTKWRPGDIIPIALYWQASEMSSSDAKVFVHLYDEQGALGPQSDGWAYHGTRPPYSWGVGETVTDPRTIALPADIAPGVYSIEVGLYRPEGERLPAYVDGARQLEDRVLLTMIRVTGKSQKASSLTVGMNGKVGNLGAAALEGFSLKKPRRKAPGSFTE